MDASYEAPENPDVTLKAGDLSVDECVQEIVKLLVDKVSLINSF